MCWQTTVALMRLFNAVGAAYVQDMLDGVWVRTLLVHDQIISK